jgi:predicted nucleic acid-binding protein
MPADRAFFDTNILVYALAARNDPRQRTAIKLLLAGGTVGVQTLNEFVNVVTGKMRTPWPDVMMWLSTIMELCPAPAPVTLSVHREGIRIAHAHRYHIYDSLMLAAALEAACTIFYTEDLHDGQTIDGMTIRNPFQDIQS